MKLELGFILDSGKWDYICDKYGLNPWCIAEGLADRKDTINISIDDAVEIGAFRKLLNIDNN